MGAGAKKREKSSIGTCLPIAISLISVIALVCVFLNYDTSNLRDGNVWKKPEVPHKDIDVPVAVDASTNLRRTESISATNEEAFPRRNSFQVDGIKFPDLAYEPSAAYPEFRSLLDIVLSWNPDSADLPPVFRETLMHFNYSNPAEREAAAKFRDAEMPFKLYGSPDIEGVRRKWTNAYLAQALEGERSHVEISKNNHFMYWVDKKRKNSKDGWKPPTKFEDMEFKEWLKIAENGDDIKIGNESVHYYFHASASPGDRSRSFVARDMNFFATDEPNFYIVNPDANKGIQCRFGMRGVIAEAHYDGGRNMVAMLKGQKRYILAPPQACKSLGIITDKDHPSYRHSVIDWSDPVQAKDRGFAGVPAIDTIVREGEILYIPSYWFHYIISLEYSIQCNSRAGSPPHGEGQGEIEECMGFKMDLNKYNQKSWGNKKNPKKSSKKQKLKNILEKYQSNTKLRDQGAPPPKSLNDLKKFNQ